MDPNKTGEEDRAGSEKSPKAAAASTDEAERAGSEKSHKAAAASTDEVERAGSKKSPKAADSTDEVKRACSEEAPKAAASTDPSAPVELTPAQKELCASLANLPWAKIFSPYPCIQPKESKFVKGIYVSSSEDEGEPVVAVDPYVYTHLKLCETGPTTPDSPPEGEEPLDQESMVAAFSDPPLLLRKMKIDGFDDENYDDFDPYETSPTSRTYRTADFDLTTFLGDDAYPTSPVISTQPKIDHAVIGGGLSNMHNTCFMNSILQCLVHTVPFLEGILSTECTCGDQINFCPWRNLRDLFQLLTMGYTYVAPNKLVENIRYFSKRFQIGQQDDAHEFLSKLRTALMECRHKEGNALIRRVFGGRLYNKFTCCACANFSRHPEDILDLQLPVQKEVYSLLNALREHTETEVFDYNCATCGTNGAKTMHKIELDQVPHIATFHLKRFDGVHKIKQELPFPLALDLVTFTVTCDVKLEYHLYAVVVHQGETPNAGHYYSFIRVSANDWYKFNDKLVQRVNVEHVLTQQAYILFYAKEGTAWFSEAIQDQKSSKESTSSAASAPGDKLQRPSPSELAQGKNVSLIRGEGTETAMTFFPEYTDWQQDMSSGGGKEAGKGPISGGPRKGG